MMIRSPFTLKSPSPRTALVLALCAASMMISCGKGEKGAAKKEKASIQVKGSDTMVNVAQAWAEEYTNVAPDVEVEVSGGGSGVGIAALERGTIDIANASRNIKPSEIEQTKKNTGKDPKEIIVGFDALAVYVNAENPIEEISIAQLEQIFAEDGATVTWTQLGTTIPGASNDEIVRISRQSSSGTYEFFREHVLNNKDFKLGSRDMNGSKEVVELVGSTKTAIGYSGMGYANDKVKMLKIKTDKGVFAPTIENTVSKAYPLARSLQMYTLGEPEGAVKNYIDWILSPAGQKLVADNGYVPLTSTN